MAHSRSPYHQIGRRGQDGPADRAFNRVSLTADGRHPLIEHSGATYCHQHLTAQPGVTSLSLTPDRALDRGFTRPVNHGRMNHGRAEIPPYPSSVGKMDGSEISTYFLLETIYKILFLVYILFVFERNREEKINRKYFFKIYLHSE